MELRRRHPRDVQVAILEHRLRLDLLRWPSPSMLQDPQGRSPGVGPPRLKVFLEHANRLRDKPLANRPFRVGGHRERSATVGLETSARLTSSDNRCALGGCVYRVPTTRTRQARSASPPRPRRRGSACHSGSAESPQACASWRKPYGRKPNLVVPLTGRMGVNRASGLQGPGSGRPTPVAGNGFRPLRRSGRRCWLTGQTQTPAWTPADASVLDGLQASGKRKPRLSGAS